MTLFLLIHSIRFGSLHLLQLQMRDGLENGTLEDA